MAAALDVPPKLLACHLSGFFTVGDVLDEHEDASADRRLRDPQEALGQLNAFSLWEKRECGSGVSGRFSSFFNNAIEAKTLRLATYAGDLIEAA